MNIDVALLPSELDRTSIADRTVIVFDVLRATTTMAAALAAGVSEIRIFDTIESARAATTAFEGPKLLAGERGCLPPPGFDLGNSPDEFTPAHAGRTVFMSTTNGTRAIVAARGARHILIGALVNAAATSRHAASLGCSVTLLCAGTDGEMTMEDIVGAGAVVNALVGSFEADDLTPNAAMALQRFRQYEDQLLAMMMRDARGGRNLPGVGLQKDLEYAARRDLLSIVGIVLDDPLRVVRV